MDKKTKIVPAEMEPGYARDEAKKIVADQLEEKGEKEYANLEGFDPSKLKVEPEIAQHYNLELNEFEVTHPVKGYHYLWGRIDYRSHMEVMSRAQRYLGTNVPGFELVDGPKDKFPECWHLRAEDGTRRIGDCQLYRVPEQVYRAISVKQQLSAAARNAGVAANVLARAARYPKYVRAMETEGDPIDALRERAHRHGGIPREQYDAAMIESLAFHEMDSDIREGNLHGIPLNKAIHKE